MTFSLHPHQADMIDRTRTALRAHRSVLLQSPTGSGKTVLGCYMTHGAVGRGRRIWFAVHRDFLIVQTCAAFEIVGIPCGVIAAGHRPSPWEPVQVCSIPTLARRLTKLTPPDLMIVDECHHAASASWARVIEWHLAGGGHLVGLTATPARLDGRGLDKWFSDMVRGPSVSWLIERGYLSRYRAFAPSQPDVTGLRTRAGDYAHEELDALMDQGAIIGDMIGHYRRLADGKRAIYFAVSVRHSQHIAALFNRAGVAARHLDAGSSAVERMDAARCLALGSCRVLTNVDLFGEGYDLAAQAGADIPVEVVGLARPTQSLTLHLQQIGRSLRPKPEPAIILDHAGNLMRHGLPDQEREWSLAGRDRDSRKSEDGPPVRMCPECYAVHPTAPACPYCGTVYEIKSRVPDEIDAELTEIDAETMARQKHADFVARKIEERQCRTVEDWEQLGRKRGYAGWYGWARHRYRAMQRRPRGGRDRGVEANG